MQIFLSTDGAPDSLVLSLRAYCVTWLQMCQMRCLPPPSWRKCLAGQQAEAAKPGGRCQACQPTGQPGPHHCGRRNGCARCYWCEIQCPSATVCTPAIDVAPRLQLCRSCRWTDSLQCVFCGAVCMTHSVLTAARHAAENDTSYRLFR